SGRPETVVKKGREEEEWRAGVGEKAGRRGLTGDDKGRVAKLRERVSVMVTGDALSEEFRLLLCGMSSDPWLYLDALAFIQNIHDQEEARKEDEAELTYSSLVLASY
ncbi:hypothetical protein Tco_1266863, partial [Tanacetum coccineum]